MFSRDFRIERPEKYKPVTSFKTKRKTIKQENTMPIIGKIMNDTLPDGFKTPVIFSSKGEAPKK